MRMSAATPGSGPDTPLDPPAGRTFWAFLRRPFAAGFLLTLGGLAAVALGLAFTNLSTVFVYIALALFIALGLDPAVHWLEGRGMSRALAIVSVTVGVLVVVAGVLLLIIPTVVEQISQFISDLPNLVADFQESDTYAWAEETFGDHVGTLLSDAQNLLTSPSNLAAIGGGVLQVGTTIATALSGSLIVVVLSLYFVASLPTMKTALIRLAPARSRETISGMTDQITASVGRYLVGMITLAFMNAVFTFIVHLAIGLPFPQLMAMTAFCITLIPLIGPVLFWIIGSVVALFTSPVSALIFAAVYVVYMQVEAYVFTPRVMNRTIAIPGSLVVIGALVGGTLLGLLGALIAIPVTASILLIIKQVIIPRQDARV
ncbi:AI-2E family transporter [Microbacterium sp. ZXX196]|nr:AI-2E family transporter [Microbacterium sp. ZXX196]